MHLIRLCCPAGIDGECFSIHGSNTANGYTNDHAWNNYQIGGSLTGTTQHHRPWFADRRSRFLGIEPAVLSNDQVMHLILPALPLAVRSPVPSA
jgi:hypothetical protein